jgi:hypothetical protein
MKQYAWMPIVILALAVVASPCRAQDTSPWHFPIRGADLIQLVDYSPFHSRPRVTLGAPCTQCPTPYKLPGIVDPKSADPKLPDPKSPDPTTPPTSPEQALTGAGEFKETQGHLNSVFAGAGAGGAVSGDPFLTSIITPLVLPGLFNSGSSQFALPLDRIFFDYGFFNGVGVFGVGSSAPQLVKRQFQDPVFIPGPSPGFGGKTIFVTRTETFVQQSTAMVPGFNLNSFNLGIEKTFFGGMASAYVAVPLLYATENITGQQINGLGDVNAGIKMILSQDVNGNTLTGGLTVAFPTAHAATSSSVIQSQNGNGDTLVTSTTTRINPTFFQPYAAGFMSFDRLFIHDYFGFIIPTDDRVSTFINNDFTIGYQLYRSNNPNSVLTSVTPMMAAQAIIPLNHVGTPSNASTATFVPFDQNGQLPTPVAPTNFLFSSQVFMVGGVQVGIGDRLFLSANVVIPVCGPRSYPAAGTFGLNYLY